jgi:hypothetical protein
MPKGLLPKRRDKMSVRERVKDLEETFRANNLPYEILTVKETPKTWETVFMLGTWGIIAIQKNPKGQVSEAWITRTELEKVMEQHTKILKREGLVI